MLKFPIVDAHVHFWDPHYINYAWLSENPSLNRPYLLDDYNYERPHQSLGYCTPADVYFSVNVPILCPDLVS